MEVRDVCQAQLWAEVGGVRQETHWTAQPLLKHFSNHLPSPCLTETPQNADFCFSDQNQPLLIWKTNLASAFPCSQDHPGHTAWSSAAHSISQLLSHGRAPEQSSQQRCLVAQEKWRAHTVPHGKGHMFFYNIHVGNTCNPFTLFTVLLSIHRRLWSSYLLSAPIIKHIYAVRQ